jgi:ABC-type lipoprotein release transport system permease subunit
MKTILFFAYRNILRQKRRAFLLGTAMALGTCFLVLASSFVAGITQTLFDRVMTYVAGHTSVIVCDRGYLYRTALRGRADLKARIGTLPHVKKVEETIGVMCRMVGARKSDNAILIGVDLRKEYTAKELEEVMDNFPMVAGRFEDLSRTDVDNPAVISRSKADFLGLSLGDGLSVRYQDSRGRMQVGRLTVVGIFQPSNAFMDAPLFVELGRAKALLEIDSTDLTYLYLTLDDPKANAVPTADSIQKMLEPRMATLPVGIEFHGKTENVIAAGVRSDSASRSRLEKTLKLARPWKGNVAVLAASTAKALGAAVGDTVVVRSGMSRAGDPMVDRLVVGGLWNPPTGAGDLALVEEDVFQAARSFRSRSPGDSGAAQVQAAGALLDSLLSPEWKLMPRARTTSDVQDQFRQIGSREWKSPVVAVRTMYEMGEQIIKLADALNLITLVAVLILFVVVLTGVVNTLRMTVRERTREIGTLRSLGMQARQVRALFLTETALLAFFSSVAGTVLALAVMFGLSRMVFAIEGNPLSMLLVRGHLVFVPGIASTIGQILLVVGMAVLAAWGPAAQAARLSPANALRHYE